MAAGGALRKVAAANAMAAEEALRKVAATAAAHREADDEAALKEKHKEAQKYAGVKPKEQAGEAAQEAARFWAKAGWQDVLAKAKAAASSAERCLEEAKAERALWPA